MKILLTTTIYSPHLIPFANEINKIAGPSKFRYYSTRKPLEWRKKMGWASHSTEPYFIQLQQDSHISEALNTYDSWWDSADVVICCERDSERIANRCKKQKLTFYMTERWWRPPLRKARLLHPSFLKMALKFRALSQSPYFHLLGIGPYAINDLTEMGYFSQRAWNWGYFTETGRNATREKPTAFSILYAGRFIKCKRLDTVVLAFGKLIKNHTNCKLHLIGGGDQEPFLRRLIKKHNLAEYIYITPHITMPEVWAEMRKTHVFILPSDEGEGWGAVLNEAMTNHCTPVATYQSGAGSAMINDKINGRLYKAGCWRSLANILIELKDNQAECTRLADAAFQTITNVWSPKTAAERLYSVSTSLLANDSPELFAEGPMTRK